MWGDGLNRKTEQTKTKAQTASSWPSPHGAEGTGAKHKNQEPPFLPPTLSTVGGDIDGAESNRGVCRNVLYRKKTGD